jgi:heme/copper-type cytochrome/quinol oxidase subunit 3
MSAVGASPRVIALPEDDGHPPGWWGMVGFILTEAALFAALIGSYFFLLSNAPQWPPAEIEPPKLLWPIIATVVLVGSSIPMYLADRSAEEGNTGAVQIWLAVAFVLAVIFLAIQLYEYSGETFGIDTTSYGSLFYTITGVHGLHVLSALVMNLVMQIQVWRRVAGHRRRLGITNVSLYWHFVDAVWVVIFISLYLTPNWLS